MKVLLYFATALGQRTIVAEIGDAATARAVVNAHLALGENAAVVEEMPRTSLRDHMAKHKKAMTKAARAKPTELPSNVTPLKKNRA